MDLGFFSLEFQPLTKNTLEIGFYNFFYLFFMNLFRSPNLSCRFNKLIWIDLDRFLPTFFN
jgi:hypothetical protein